MQNPKPVLRVDWCGYDAAKYAVEHWHYSEVLPAGKLLKIGAWEDGRFIGCVLFGRGANNNIGKPYGLRQTECAELVRIALDKHVTPVSRIASLAIKFAVRQSPGLRLLISYADTAHNHHGGIYQAMGWIYQGASNSGAAQIQWPDGRMEHKRSVFSRYGTESSKTLGAKLVSPPVKHKYLYALDNAMRAQIAPLAKPYPKRDSCAGSKDSVVTDSNQ